MSQKDTTDRTEMYDENPLARFERKVDAVTYEDLQAEKQSRRE